MITKPNILPTPIAPPLPEVYQIEVSSVCNFNCIMCPTQFFPRKDKTKFISLDLVKKIIDQGDLDASYFVELQMSGEPLLHPNIEEIIDIVKSTGVLVGMSTNGSMIAKKLEAIAKLDYLTVSIDSLSEYENIRKNGSKEILLENLEYLIGTAQKYNIVVDLQLVELEGWEKEKEKIEKMYGFFFNVRSVPNCYLPYFFSEINLPTSTELCLNPWLSVSIACNGNVTACCIAQGDDIQLGNLKEQTLREVWQGREIRSLRKEHLRKDYRPVCAKCYMRSPFLFHWNLYLQSIKRRY